MANTQGRKPIPDDMASQPELPLGQFEWLDPILPIYARLQPYLRDLVGLLLLGSALITLLALIGGTSGGWINPWANFLRRWMGLGSFFIALGIAVAGLILLNKNREPFTATTWFRLIALELAAFASIALFAILGGEDLQRAEAGQDGGLIGWSVAQFLHLILQSLPPLASTSLRVAILLIIVAIGLFYGLRLFGPIIRWLDWVLVRSRKESAAPVAQSGGVVIAPTEDTAKPLRPSARQKRKVDPQFRKQFEVDKQEDKKPVEPLQRDESLPSLDMLLTDKGYKPDKRHINQTAGLIEQTLDEFGIPAKVVGFNVGPTVTQFAIEPGYIKRAGDEGEDAKHKVRVSQISGLQRDLALALSAKRLRIQAPVPGRSFVGIEVPNERSAIVRMRSILESEEFAKLGSPLGVALGRDVSGNPVVADLGRMPHLLIAGTTGSGKSICIAALTIGLVMNNSPEDLRLVMIDPKMVEMVRFNGLPHLYGKVETDLERSSAVLRWVVAEMERRYKLLEELRARDIESYNRKARRRKEAEHMPRIVVLIDELADLMMNAAEHTETTIVRLAQMARAVGIHLVIATQRPSTDVVTGLIKANFPARLSFAVASAIDSRVILDMTGAESLLGNGDMLFLPPEIGIPVRSQGVLITDKEIQKVIDYWSNQWEKEENDSPWEKMLEQDAILADRDDLIEDAIELIQNTGRVSASMLQRRLKVGYPRAARLVDELEDLGIIGPSQGGGRQREILINLDEGLEDEEE